MDHFYGAFLVTEPPIYVKDLREDSSKYLLFLSHIKKREKKNMKHMRMSK